MKEYNFDNLSPYDFELLMRDLIQSVEGIKLRSFAPGRDRGIDLRGWETENPPRAVIVQCKHMAHSSWAAIKASIEKERLKLDRLEEKPSRYILAVTKPLTVQNVDELFQILRPYCRTPDDILDVAAVEQLLDSKDTVVRKHYKLWITSTTILQRILYAGIYNRSESYREDLLRKSRTFVQPDAFARAQRSLKENHSCIISGPPGVGSLVSKNAIARSRSRRKSRNSKVVSWCKGCSGGSTVTGSAVIGAVPKVITARLRNRAVTSCHAACGPLMQGHDVARLGRSNWRYSSVSIRVDTS